MRIAVCGTKGGSGKSTLAGLLALCFADAGRKVCAIDQDPQATLTTWLRSVGGKPAPWGKGKKELEEVYRTWTCVGEWEKNESPSDDHIWINDFPPASPQVLLKMLGRADYPTANGKQYELYDYLLIPCRPAVADIWSIRSFLAELDGYNAKVRLVMNALDNSLMSKAGSIESLLEGVKTPRTKATLSRRTCYSVSMVSGWKALDEKAKSEVLSLALELSK